MVDDDEAIGWKQPAAARGRALLELPGGAELAHRPLVARHHLAREARQEQELAVLLARVAEADRGNAAPVGLELHRQAEVLVAELALEDMAVEVLLVQPLHHDDDR